MRPISPNAVSSMTPLFGTRAAPVCPGQIIGDVLYWTGVDWCRLPPGVAGQHLETNGNGVAPSWENVPDAQAFDYFTPERAVYPAATPAVPGATGDVPVVDYAQAVGSQVLYAGAADEKYTGAPFDVDVFWFADVAVVGDVLWEAQFVRQGDTDLVTRPFAAAQSVLSTVPGVVGTIEQATIPFTQAQADGLAAGDPYRLLVRRAGGDATDTMLDTARVLAVTVIEP